ncbi:CYTH domain-containing protein [Falsirhodobacter sp. 1013]|uniref:CYTH domain-containing protein n=1 Tax=Falsirhodobacter sp. 1013 TaxID=3417566 RepID=UPI003EB7ABA8
MLVEIERKFLITSGTWRAGVRKTWHITDHLIAKFELGKARIRICEGEAMLTFKGQRSGCKRSEYHIPLDDQHARAMIADFSTAPAIEKNRHDVEVAGLVWQVDEYLGPLAGFVTADVELLREDHPLVLPTWAGREITSDARFGSAALVTAAHQGGGTVARLLKAAASSSSV